MTETLVGFGTHVELKPSESWSHKHPSNYILNLREGRLGLKVGSDPAHEIVLLPGTKVDIPEETEHSISNLTDRLVLLSCGEDGKCAVEFSNDDNNFQPCIPTVGPDPTGLFPD